MISQTRGQQGTLDLIVVEDSAVDAELEVDALRKAGLTVEVRRVEDEPAFRAALDERLPDAILSDWTLPLFSGRRALEIAHERCPDVPFIFVSGTISESAAIEALRQGAIDYVYKHQLQLLGPALLRAVNEARMLCSLKESEERYRFLFNGITDAVYVHEVSIEKPGKFIAVNKGACSMLGYTMVEFLQMEVKDIDIPEQTEKTPFIHEKLFKDGYAILETCHVAKDGRKIPVEINVRLFDFKGKQMVLLVARDITERKRAEEELKFQNVILSTQQEVSIDGILVVDESSTIISYNQRFVEMWGVPPKLVESKDDEPVLQYVATQPVDSEGFLARVKYLYEHKQDTSRDEIELLDGRTFDRYSAPMIGDDGRYYGRVWYFRDISERKQAETALRQSEAELREAQRVANVGSWELDWKTGTVTWSEEIYRIFGLDPALSAPTLSEHPQILTSSSKSQLDSAIAMTLRTEEPFEVDLELICPDGTTRWITARGEIKLKDAIFTMLRGTALDITERKRMEEKLKHLAYYDALTGLPNRNLFLEKINQEIARAKDSSGSIAVVITDINKFKPIYDIYGSEVGDSVLKEVAERLSTSVRKGDTVAHLGNDEFGIACIGLSGADDIIMLEKIIKDISYPLTIDGEEITLTFSTGISLYPHDGGNASELLKSAGLALSIAKKEGKKTSQFYTKDMTVTASEIMLLEKQLITAIKNDEFILHYQPYWDITTRKMVGMEALVRWQSKDKGLVPPGKFIPILEDTGMIIEVGEWILREAIRQVKEWQDKKYPVVPVSVNMSLVQFRQKDLSEMVKRIMGEYGFYPSLLTLEITESAFMQDIEFTKWVLTAMKEIGCSVSIDDFGTGYSSLAYLKRFPVDNLKIDISFIREMINDPDSASIVMAIINMAHTLNLKTIAEGIETEEQWNILRLFRCDMGQGFYLSKPLPPEEFEKLLI
jgi:diguanylate cyclase (GGDEF)-like protein/PAS domain S-box-containing protein